jgi:hypothetical protein
MKPAIIVLAAATAWELSGQKDKMSKLLFPLSDCFQKRLELQ